MEEVEKGILGGSGHQSWGKEDADVDWEWQRCNFKEKLHKYAYGAKEMQLELSQQLFYFDDMKGVFDKDRNIVDGICGIKMLKQNTRERNWKDQKKPQ